METSNYQFVMQWEQAFSGYTAEYTRHHNSNAIERMKEMELNKLVNRTVYNDSPVLVEYTVTPYCKTFGDIILEMIKWGKAHRELVTGKQRP